jgi:hypothetical protein
MLRDLHQSQVFCQLKEENIQFKPDKSGYHFLAVTNLMDGSAIR